jgi:hypothetical protein
VTEPHSGIIGTAINSDNMLDMTTKDSTEIQKVIADLLNDDRNCFDLLALTLIAELIFWDKIFVERCC